MVLIDVLIVIAALLFMVAVFACAWTGRPSSSALPQGHARRRRRAF